MIGIAKQTATGAATIRANRIGMGRREANRVHGQRPPEG